jgi:hypothetical protein
LSKKPTGSSRSDGDPVKKMRALRAIVRSQIKNALKAPGRAQLDAIAMVQAAEQTLAAIAAAAAAAKAADEVDTSRVSDLDLARWILSILESTANEVDANEATATKAAGPQPAPAPDALPPPKKPTTDPQSGSSNLH